MSKDPPYQDVMLADPVFGPVWERPGLSRRDRRFVTLTCVCALETVDHMNQHMYAALASGDISYDELMEFVLHFAVYCGWPRASEAEGAARNQWAQLAAERGQDVPPRPDLPVESLGPTDHHVRLDEGEKCFVDVNLLPPPPRDSPYFQAGILAFVFGHLWQRPDLDRRERRLITVAAVGVSGAIGPIYSHVGAALESGDVSRSEMTEVILQFSAYSGFSKGRLLQTAADESWRRISAAGPKGD
ncbi:carboxymuconolactone decarboxylase family protein [Mycolicibacterium sp. ND9-15]|uniref:carboxymuconolactone decarboxylase family protein n=1 Tax=Mycolicibacterium sp. ND9-15 TaxID=3042320 RepID=UPI002DD8E86A|nr:carboxymuconolactone decarboxylase family protein [Mycolicibacterium sp. ND9-15]WSE57844.1 carboxymuconolactone decarboxylase family protein [Mycolicibacterium sp. ND9-15]